MTKIGWFDAFRDDGNPSDFEVGPAPFFPNLQLIGLLSIFVVPTIAFLIVLPGIRRLKLISTFTFIFTMFTGATLLVSIFHPFWQSAETQILANYRSFECRQINAYLKVRIGLSKVNITLISEVPALNYNEQFELRNRNPVEFERGLRYGLPYPFLVIMEYLTIDLDGFDWGKKLHFSGYYTSAFLWFSFSLWLVKLLFLFILPSKFGVMNLCIGLVTLSANLCYFLSTPNQLIIRFPSPQGEPAFLKFHFSYCFYAVFISGISSTVIGLGLILARRYFKYTLDTSISSYSTYRDQTGGGLRQKQESMIGSLRNLGIFVINSKQMDEDARSLTSGNLRNVKSFDSFCLHKSPSRINKFSHSRVLFF